MLCCCAVGGCWGLLCCLRRGLGLACGCLRGACALVCLPCVGMFFDVDYLTALPCIFCMQSAAAHLAWLRSVQERRVTVSCG